MPTATSELVDPTQVKSSEVERLTNVLTSLGKKKVTRMALKKTKLKEAVRAMQKHRDERVVQAATALRQRWAEVEIF